MFNNKIETIGIHHIADPIICFDDNAIIDSRCESKHSMQVLMAMIFSYISSSYLTAIGFNLPKCTAKKTIISIESYQPIFLGSYILNAFSLNDKSKR